MKNLIEEYIAEVKTVSKNSRPFSGIFGFKGGVGNSPCHLRFYNAMKEVTESDDCSAYEAVSLLLRADSEYEAPNAAKLMLTAVQGLAIPLVEKLDDAQRAEFRQYFDDNIPRRKRLPVQDQLYKALLRRPPVTR